MSIYGEKNNNKKGVIIISGCVEQKRGSLHLLPLLPLTLLLFFETSDVDDSASDIKALVYFIFFVYAYQSH